MNTTSFEHLSKLIKSETDDAKNAMALAKYYRAERSKRERAIKAMSRELAALFRYIEKSERAYAVAERRVNAQFDRFEKRIA